MNDPRRVVDLRDEEPIVLQQLTPKQAKAFRLKSPHRDEVEYVPMATGKKRTLHFVLLAGSRWTIRRQAICGTAGNALDMTCLGEDWVRADILEEHAGKPGVCKRCIATLRRIQ